MLERIRVFSGNANIALATKICQHLGVSLGKANVTTFSDGETRVEINENVRGMDVFIIQSTCPPVNVTCMELLIMIDALKRASADRITAVVPYYGYGRQDRKVAPRAPITAKLLADLITAAGANRVLSMDLHAGQIQGFFNIPVDNLFATPVLFDYMKKNYIDGTVVVSPDTGGVERARAFGKRLGASLAIIDKRREGPNEAEVMNIIGEVEGHNVVLFDDLVTTARTLCQAAETIRKHGAKDIYAGVTHGIFAPGALERIQQSPIRELVVTDTICHPPDSIGSNVRELSVAGLLGEAVARIHEERSLSSLFV